MSETELPAEKGNDGWWISFVLRWGLLFPAQAYATGGVTPRPPGQIAFPLLIAWWAGRRLAGRLFAPYSHSVNVAAQWLVVHVFGLNRPGGQFWGLDQFIMCRSGLFLWTIFERRNRTNAVLRELSPLVVRYLLAASMLSYGMAKLVERQGIFQPNPLDWFRPLGEIPTGQLMWTWLGYSPAFQFFAGLNETLGGVLLLFRRTTLWRRS